MARKGQRLFECKECNNKQFIHWIERNRRGLPRCLQCGSQRLEIVSDEAKDEQCRLQRERITGTGGSLKLANGENNTRRKVV